MEVGHSQWSSPSLNYAWDYLVMPFDMELADLRKVPAGYVDMARMSHAVLRSFQGAFVLLGAACMDLWGGSHVFFTVPKRSIDQSTRRAM